MYSITYSDTAIKELSALRKSSVASFNKAAKLIEELKEHPYTGTGHPEQLKHLNGVWSRRIDKKNRLRYTVNDNIVTVYVISAMGHYEDK